MKSKLNKILTVITAVTFAAALTLNIQASLSDPLAEMSDEALALTSTDSGTTATGSKCYYNVVYTGDLNDEVIKCLGQGYCATYKKSKKKTNSPESTCSHM